MLSKTFCHIHECKHTPMHTPPTQQLNGHSSVNLNEPITTLILMGDFC